MISAFSASYRLAVRSHEAVITWFPPGSQSAAMITDECPVSSCSGCRWYTGSCLSSDESTPVIASRYWIDEQLFGSTGFSFTALPLKNSESTQIVHGQQKRPIQFDNKARETPNVKSLPSSKSGSPSRISLAIGESFCTHLQHLRVLTLRVHLQTSEISEEEITNHLQFSSTTSTRRVTSKCFKRNSVQGVQISKHDD